MDTTKPYFEAIVTFDGRNMTELRSCARTLEFSDADIDVLLELSESTTSRVGSGATWLLKALIEGGRPISSKQLGRWAEAARGYVCWQSALHFCQVVRLLRVDKEELLLVSSQLVSFLNHERPLVGVWALDGLVHLSDAYRELVPQAIAALEEMKLVSKPSVQARIRNLLRTRPYLGSVS